MNQNQTLINNKFKELNINLTKDELERAEYYLVRYGKAKGVRESDNGKWHYFVDENNNIDEEVLSIYQSGNVRTHGRDYSSLKSHLLQCQNIHHIYVKEKPYSIDKSNKIARYIRKLNDLMENESFLKSLRYLNPNIDTKDSFRFAESIHSIVSKIFDLDDTNFTDSVAAINDRNFIRYFFASESLISNTKLFWIVFRTIWERSNFNEINTTQWSDVFSRYNRLENLVFDNVHHARGKVYAQANKDILRNYSLEDYITVYRGFLVPSHAYVRKNKLKLNNTESFIQQTGKGYSFTMDKQIAIRFGSRYHYNTDFRFRKSFPTLFGNYSSNKIDKLLQKEYKKQLNGFYNQNYLRNDVRRCFATYKIKKKHLIFCDLPEKECEVIADPNNAELVRYDFINDQMDIDSAIYNFRTKPLFENHLDKVCKDLVKQNDFLMIKDDFGRVCQISYKNIDLENLLRFQ